MKTKVNNTNTKTIKTAFNNPFGMSITNKPEIREAVANYAKSIIAKLHEERNKKNAQ